MLEDETRWSLAGDDPPIEEIRRALDEAVRHSSLRGVAREVGLSPTGLRRVLAGSTPYAATLRKLRRWHERAGNGAWLAVWEVESALFTLTAALPPERREPVVSQIIDRLSRAFVRTSPPPWLEEVRARSQRRLEGLKGGERR